ncbi:MAG: trehalase family glycosidase [Woeseiaceae bacterium]|nr:trehalase family glycosidase [Woeseiaceae bacterium]
MTWQDDAANILLANDRDGHTVPTDGLYPFQWSWDSAITALGWLTFDEARAWREAAVMFDGQWDTGMVPHILFHGDSSTYFPGPDVWGGGQRIPSSAISQPAVWATAIRMMYEAAKDKSLAEASVQTLLPMLVDYHDWWYRDRDPDETGLVRSFHPWESGMDNSPAWDDPLARVPPVDWEYQRRDLGHVDSSERPHKPEYDRYLYLVDFYKKNGFDAKRIYEGCPYRVIDVGLVAILHRAGKDLLALCRELHRDLDVSGIVAGLEGTTEAIHSLWSEDDSCFLNYDDIADEPLPFRTTATLLPLFAGLATAEQADRMAALIEEWLSASAFGIASTHPAEERYEPQRYWRGPVWLHINWMIADGLTQYGFHDLAADVRAATKKCVDASGFYEYFDADSGKGCGGGSFSWTAAVALYWLADD